MTLITETDFMNVDEKINGRGLMGPAESTMAYEANRHKTLAE